MFTDDCWCIILGRPIKIYQMSVFSKCYLTCTPSDVLVSKSLHCLKLSSLLYLTTCDNLTNFIMSCQIQHWSRHEFMTTSMLDLTSHSTVRSPRPASHLVALHNLDRSLHPFTYITHQNWHQFVSVNKTFFCIFHCCLMPKLYIW